MGGDRRGRGRGARGRGEGGEEAAVGAAEEKSPGEKKRKQQAIWQSFGKDKVPELATPKKTLADAFRERGASKSFSSPGLGSSGVSQAAGSSGELPSPAAGTSGELQSPAAGSSGEFIKPAAGSKPKGGAFDRFGDLRSNVGGRHRIPEVMKRGREGSHRRKVGEKPLRTERPPQEKLKIAIDMKARMKDFEDSDSGRQAYWDAILRDYDWHTRKSASRKDKKKALREIMENQDKWQKQVDEEGLGMGTGYTKDLPQGRKAHREKQYKKASGKRQPGAGCKNIFLSEWQKVPLLLLVRCTRCSQTGGGFINHMVR